MAHKVRVRQTGSTPTCEGTEVARHARCLAKHQSLLAADHARVLRAMRADQRLVAPADTLVEQRDLADYDRALGVA